MINDFSDKIAYLDDKTSVNQFWHEKIKELYSNRDKVREFEREIIELCPSLKGIIERYPSELMENHKLFNLNRWDQQDANPIFYGYIPKTRRAVRIIQCAPQDETNQLSAWVEKSFTDFKEIRSFDASSSYELVINLEMNIITFRYAMILIYFWISRKGVKQNEEEFLIGNVYAKKIRGQYSLDD